MRTYRLVAAVIVALVVLPRAVPADEVRFYQKDGVTYREIRRTVERPVVDVQLQEQKETIYRQQVETEPRVVSQPVAVPVTTYYCQRRVHGWWSPGQPSSVTYRWVPRTHWEWRLATIQVPVTRIEWVPETRTVKRPVRKLRIETEQRVDRVAIGRPPTRRTAANLPNQRSAGANRYGGIWRLENDPPRFSTRPPAAGQPLRR